MGPRVGARRQVIHQASVLPRVSGGELREQAMGLGGESNDGGNISQSLKVILSEHVIPRVEYGECALLPKQRLQVVPSPEHLVC